MFSVAPTIPEHWVKNWPESADHIIGKAYSRCLEGPIMGARVKENNVDLIVSLEDFYRRVGAVHNYYELEWLGLTGHDFCGVFAGQLLPLLLTFCDENPEYHLVSSVGVGHFVNRLMYDADFYMIARGDRDPAFELKFLLDPQWPLIYEEGMAAAIAEIDNIKNSRKF